MKLNDFRSLLTHEVRDLLYAEKQLVKALPKMAEAASNEALREAFESHLEETKGQVSRLERVCEELGIAARGEKCEAMLGLIEEGQERVDSDGNDAVRDAALISAAQRVEHYEIAAYGSARAFAELLGLDTVVSLLQETLDEESAADEKLNSIALTVVNERALASAATS
ncbi:MAG: ferritin-like domain-containing protein [Phycisphaerales bacterium]|nr:MAG: ferritin-like domain-containing protein [Phycisphaerales bacterium]